MCVMMCMYVAWIDNSLVMLLLFTLLSSLHMHFLSPFSLPPVSLPNSRYFLILLPNAFVISVVSFAVSVSLSKVLAKKYQYMVNANQVCIRVYFSRYLDRTQFTCTT